MNPNEDPAALRSLAMAVIGVVASITFGISGYAVAKDHQITERVETCVKAGGTWDDTRVGGAVCEVGR